MRSISRASAPALAAVFGATGIGVIILVFWLALPDAPTEIPALLLLLVITTASVMSSWRVGVPIAVLGGLAHTFFLLPPFGTITFGYTEDVVIILTFVLVAVLVSVLVSRRSIANHAELIGRERMLLLRSVSHDVRNPLNAILTASTELRDGADYEPESRQRLLDTIVDETRRLDRIVDNLLGLSRLQAGALIPSRQLVSVSELLDQQRSRFAMIGADGDRLDLIEPEPDLDVDVDPVQIDQVLTNLVENSVRHAPAPVHVTISVAPRNGMVEWRVSDDGPGFSNSTRQSLFAPFHSTDGSSGLGLTVCKAVVEAHGGTITVDDHVGGGASIRFTVPSGR